MRGQDLGSKYRIWDKIIMDVGLLDKSATMAPLLVRLYDSQKLHSLAKDEKPKARQELGEAVAELLKLDLSPREAEMVSDILISLLRQAELDLKQALAERLATMENVPLRLILNLAGDEICVAGAVLRQSKILSDLDLIYIIKSKGAEHWQAIAQRQQISGQIINILADTGEDGTLMNLVQNTGITLTEYAIDVMAESAAKSEGLAKPLLARSEVGPDIAKRLYQYVGEALKEYILEEYKIANKENMAALVDEVMGEFEKAADAFADITPNEVMLEAADRYKSKGLLTTKLMLGSLRRGQVQHFVAQFSRFTAMAPDTVVDIVKQKNGQGLAVTCKACNIEKADFISIFLLTNRARKGDRMVDLKDLTKATQYFERVSESVAKDILNSSLDEALKD
ncbi:MAG: DUF2336 domain-containing protein [Bdellovibrionales bacterium]